MLQYLEFILARFQSDDVLVNAVAPTGSTTYLNSHCIAQGINMTTGLENQKEAVISGHFPLYRYNPMLTAQGKNPLTLDSKEPTMSFSEHALKENRFKVLTKTNPENAKKLLAQADKMVKAKFDLLQKLANLEPCNTD